jgi:hypothetical protein
MRRREEFNRLAQAYFARSQGGATKGRGSSPQKQIGVLLLVDSRHPGLESDLDAWSWLASQPCPRGVVGTKVDKTDTSGTLTVRP